MKALIIYDSNFGNTKLIAETIAKTLSATALNVKDANAEILKDINLLVVGSPINAWRATAKIKEFLEGINSLKGIKAAAFDTRVKIFISGNAAKKISKKLSEKGAEIISEPIGFYVKDNEGPLLEGETEKAKKWATEILNNMNK